MVDDFLEEDCHLVAFHLEDDHLEGYLSLVDRLDLVAFLGLGDADLVAFLGRVDQPGLVAFLSLGDADLVAYLDRGVLEVSKNCGYLKISYLTWVCTSSFSSHSILSNILR